MVQAAGKGRPESPDRGERELQDMRKHPCSGELRGTRV